MRGVTVPPSKLIVTNTCPLQGGGFLLGGFLMRGVRSNQKSFLMRGVIVPPSKLIVKHICPSPQGGGSYLGGVLLRGGD